MTLEVVAQTNIKDLVIDYIEVQRKGRQPECLSWDRSSIARTAGGFVATYADVQSGEEYVTDPAGTFNCMKVLSVQAYSSEQGKEFLEGTDLVITSMQFTDDTNTSITLFAPLYSGSTFELQRKNIYVTNYTEVNQVAGRGVLTMIVLPLFDVSKKFGVPIADYGDDASLSMHVIYDPFEDTLSVECIIVSSDACKEFRYEPTQNESELIKELLAERIEELYHQTPQEFCEAELEAQQKG